MDVESRPVDDGQSLPLTTDQIEALRAAARDAVQREVASRATHTVRSGLLVGMALGATILVIVLWALGFGNPR
jgi:hypothetical protein